MGRRASCFLSVTELRRFVNQVKQGYATVSTFDNGAKSGMEGDWEGGREGGSEGGRETGRGISERAFWSSMIYVSGTGRVSDPYTVLLIHPPSWGRQDPTPVQ